jgi:hypothetical protein
MEKVMSGGWQGSMRLQALIPSPGYDANLLNDIPPFFLTLKLDGWTKAIVFLTCRVWQIVVAQFVLDVTLRQKEKVILFSNDLFVVLSSCKFKMSDILFFFPSSVVNHSPAFLGYLEDRRPASNMDPYVVTSLLAESTILWEPTLEAEALAAHKLQLQV